VKVEVEVEAGVGCVVVKASKVFTVDGSTGVNGSKKLASGVGVGVEVKVEVEVEAGVGCVVVKVSWGYTVDGNTLRGLNSSPSNRLPSDGCEGGNEEVEVGDATKRFSSERERGKGEGMTAPGIEKGLEGLSVGAGMKKGLNGSSGGAVTKTAWQPPPVGWVTLRGSDVGLTGEAVNQSIAGRAELGVEWVVAGAGSAVLGVEWVVVAGVGAGVVE
jgi:hypothetical protein